MKRIVIDPGHGGQDLGYIGSRVLEKDVTLALALLLNEALNNIGFTVICTRETDTFLPLKNRCEIANTANANAFISFHCNASYNPGARGLETLVYENKGPTGNLARALQEQLAEVSGLHNRGVRERPILTILNGIYIPAVVVELGFLSNPKEETLLSDNNFLHKSANAISNLLTAHFK